LSDFPAGLCGYCWHRLVIRSIRLETFSVANGIIKSAPGKGRLVLVVVAFEGLAVTTIMPVAVRALHGLPLCAWSFSGFMLGSLVGTVAAGDYASARGVAFSFTGVLVILAVGLITCGCANSMLLFIAGRVIEGLGTGAVRSLAWFAINRAYSARDHVSMGAVLSSAYIVPTLIGPTAAGVIVEAWGWRLVFFALLPLVPLALWLIVRALTQVAITQAASTFEARKSATAVVMGSSAERKLTAILCAAWELLRA
jgi:MFS family permease